MKITYQGQHIEAEMVNGVSGDLAILPDKYHEGEESILRDINGRYYLRRCLRKLDTELSKQRRAYYGVHLHRISVKAAALWAVARTSPQTRELRQDLDRLLSGFGTPGFPDLNHEAERHLREYVQSRGVDPRDALSGAVIMALSASGLAADEAVEYARDLRLDEERDNAAPGGCTVRFSALDGSDPWEVFLEPDVTAGIEKRAEAEGRTFGETILAMITRRAALESEDTIAVKSVVSRDTYEAAGRYCAQHGRSVEEALTEWLEDFAKQAPDEAAMNAAADRADCALCAAAKPAADDDEDDEPLTPDGGDKAA